jgi:hypothetical protein
VDHTRQQPTNRQPVNNRNSPFSRGKEKAGELAKKGVKKAGKAAGNALKQGAKKFAKEGAKELVKKGLAATSEYWGPVVIIVIIIILLIVFIFMLLGMAGQTAQDNSESTKISAVSVSKTVNKTEMPNPTGLSEQEKTITYTIVSTLDGKAEELRTKEKIPDGLTFVSATGDFTAYNDNGEVITDISTLASAIKTVLWSTNKSASTSGTQQNTPIPSDGSSQASQNSPTPSNSSASITSIPPQTYTLVLKVTDALKDTYVVNYATAEAIGAEPESTTTTTSTNTPSNPHASTFLQLIAGQGRNIGVLGNEDSFVSTVMKNGSQRFGGDVSSQDIHNVYTAAVGKNVNPLIVLTIWGVEQSFGKDLSFGCISKPRDFPTQLSCSTNSLNNLMALFEEQEKKGNVPYTVTAKDPNSDGTNTCTFTDAFEYAYERYTPVCLMEHGNDNARKNFVTIYKELLGVK